jgi:hypothetical protein
MKKVVLFLSLVVSSFLHAQQQDPVHWSARYVKTSATEGEVIISALIDKNWHTYSQKASADGPIPTSFTITPPKGVQLSGEVLESPPHEEFVPAFGAKISIFSDKAEFRQKLKTNGKSGQVLAIKVEYMTCNDNMCLPPKTAELSVKMQ